MIVGNGVFMVKLHKTNPRLKVMAVKDTRLQLKTNTRVRKNIMATMQRCSKVSMEMLAKTVML